VAGPEGCVERKHGFSGTQCLVQIMTHPYSKQVLLLNWAIIYIVQLYSTLDI
jgi:hypothetical protein